MLFIIKGEQFTADSWISQSGRISLADKNSVFERLSGMHKAAIQTPQNQLLTQNRLVAKFKRKVAGHSLFPELKSFSISGDELDVILQISGITRITTGSEVNGILCLSTKEGHVLADCEYAMDSAFLIAKWPELVTVRWNDGRGTRFSRGIVTAGGRDVMQIRGPSYQQMAEGAQVIFEISCYGEKICKVYYDGKWDFSLKHIFERFLKDQLILAEMQQPRSESFLQQPWASKAFITSLAGVLFLPRIVSTAFLA